VIQRSKEMFPPMSSNPSAGRTGTPRWVQTTAQHLAELRDLGVITSEEFEVMKARIVHGG
jgi:hypothetical protein